MSKTRLFFAMFSIIAVLLCVNHVLHFVSPLIQMSTEEGEIPFDNETGDDLTTWEFLEMATFFENYNWSDYDVNDFPDWLYMPDEYPGGLNSSDNESVPPFFGYHWDVYNSEDFPNWLDMPDTLPTDFDRHDPEYVMDFIADHIDPEFMESMEDGMSDLADVENPEDLLSGDNFDLGSLLGSIISVWELVYGIVWLGIAIVLFIVSRSVE